LILRIFVYVGMPLGRSIDLARDVLLCSVALATVALCTVALFVIGVLWFLLELSDALVMMRSSISPPRLVVTRPDLGPWRSASGRWPYAGSLYRHTRSMSVPHLFTHIPNPYIGFHTELAHADMTIIPV
jgi:hypothetical protein